MNEITAQLNSYRQSPRKVRLVADALRGKSVEEAKNKLNFIIKRAVSPLHKLLNSAVANAKNLGFEAKDLKVKAITVDGGQILYRRRPAWHGMAHPIHKRTSHITIVLAETSNKSQVTSNKKVKSNKSPVKS
jgi:large subunit ribosomal protein L22